MKRGRSGGTPASGTASTNVMIRRHVSVSPRLAATHSSVQSNRRNFVGVVTVRHRPTSIRGALCCRANANASRISRLGKSKKASGGVPVVAESSGAWLFPNTEVVTVKRSRRDEVFSPSFLTDNVRNATDLMAPMS